MPTVGPDAHGLESARQPGPGGVGREGENRLQRSRLPDRWSIGSNHGTPRSESTPGLGWHRDRKGSRSRWTPSNGQRERVFGCSAVNENTAACLSRHAAVVIAVERPIRWPGSNGIIDVLEIRNRWGTRPRLGAIVAGRWHSVVGIGRLATIGRFWR